MPPYNLIGLFTQKRQHILRLIGFHGKPAELKYISKLAFRKHHETERQLIKRSLHDDSILKLNHLSKINKSIIHLAMTYPDAYKSKLLSNYSSSWDDRELFQLTKDIERIAKDLHEYNSTEIIFNCKSLSELEATHDRLVERVRDRIVRSLPWNNPDNSHKEENFNFPIPPVPGNDNINPILDYKSLCTEGHEQNHCVSSYVHDIMKGKYYVYKVDKPERVTIGIEISAAGTIQLDQIKSYRNKPPSQSTAQMVYEWLSGNRNQV